MSAQEKAELWTRWRQGESLASIARSLERGVGALYPVVAATGGIPPLPRTRSGRVLSLAEREELSRGLARGDSLRQIGRQLRRAPSTISREVRRYGGRRAYRAAVADSGAWARARRPKRCRLAQSHLLCTLVAKKLTLDWSPQQISQWLRGTFPDDPELHVSHETIYRSLYVQSRGVLKRELIAHLRRRHRLRRAHPATRTRHRNHGIADAVSIRERPAEVADRAVPGHWEGDLLTGAHNSHIATLVERQTRFVQLVPVPNKETHTVVAALKTAVGALPEGLMVLADAGSGERVCGAPALHRGDERQRLLLRPAESVAAGFEREHERVVAPVLSERDGPVALHPGRFGRSRPPLEYTSPQDAGIRNASC